MHSQNTVSPYSMPQGKFHVNNSGQARYTLPIKTPPGRGGLQPRISLAYSNQRSNGFCGIGWNLEGISVITRSKAIYAIDGFRGGVNYDKDDRLCLDGQRLINISGEYGQANTIYYTEIHHWTKIVAGNTPQDGFIVYLKNGEKHYYGSTPDSRILTNDKKYVRVWALSSIEDLTGNTISYSYTTTPEGTSDTDPSEDFYLEQITYGSIKIAFSYTRRIQDPLITYLSGNCIKTSFLLTQISVTLEENTLIRKYLLQYEESSATGQSRLSSITEYDGSGNALPALELAWQDIPSPTIETSTAISVLQNTESLKQSIPLDINGDGITDIVQIYIDKANCLHAISYMAAGTQEDINYTRQQDIRLSEYTDGYQILAADVSGTGKNDLVIAYEDSATQSLMFDVYFSIGQGFADSPATSKTNIPWQREDLLQFYAIDIDGDGRTDIVQAYSNSSSGASLLSFNIFQSDYCAADGSFKLLQTVNTQYTCPTNSDYLWAIDVNQDGIMDMVLL